MPKTVYEKLNPRNKRIRGVLDEAEENFQRYLGALQQYRQAHKEDQLVQAHSDLIEGLNKLVRMDNRQFHHPYVQTFLLEWPPSKDDLRRLHRGLEAGVKRPWYDALQHGTINEIIEGREAQNRKSYEQIRRQLKNKGLTSVSRQAVHKSWKKYKPRAYEPSYNRSGIPPLPKKLPRFIAGARKAASSNLNQWRAFDGPAELYAYWFRNEVERLEVKKHRKKQTS